MTRKFWPTNREKCTQIVGIHIFAILTKRMIGLSQPLDFKMVSGHSLNSFSLCRKQTVSLLLDVEENEIVDNM